MNRWMASLKQAVAAAAALLVVLASVGSALHEHDADVQAAGHADCDACHLRHLAGVEAAGAPAPAAPDPVAAAVVSVSPDAGRPAELGIAPTRGPPA